MLKYINKGLRKCYNCKDVLPLTNDFFYKRKSESAGLSYLCIKCRSKTKVTRFHTYKYGAKIRKIEFLLTKAQFMKFWKKQCYYCGDKVETIGLDRINNDVGYTINNIVSCCEKCNRMKMNMTRKEFINQCTKIYKNSPGETEL